MRYHLSLVKFYSRLDSDAEFLINQYNEFYTLRSAQKALLKIQKKLAPKRLKSDWLPRIDIIRNDGKVYKWGK